jgi:hypothetical protein
MRSQPAKERAACKIGHQMEPVLLKALLETEIEGISVKEIATPGLVMKTGKA